MRGRGDEQRTGITPTPGVKQLSHIKTTGGEDFPRTRGNQSNFNDRVEQHENLEDPQMQK